MVVTLNCIHTKNVLQTESNALSAKLWFYAWVELSNTPHSSPEFSRKNCLEAFGFQRLGVIVELRGGLKARRKVISIIFYDGFQDLIN